MTARDVTGFFALSLRPGIGRLSPHFAAISSLKFQISVPCRGRTRPEFTWPGSLQRGSHESRAVGLSMVQVALLISEIPVSTQFIHTFFYGAKFYAPPPLHPWKYPSRGGGCIKGGGGAHKIPAAHPPPLKMSFGQEWGGGEGRIYFLPGIYSPRIFLGIGSASYT